MISVASSVLKLRENGRRMRCLLSRKDLLIYSITHLSRLCTHFRHKNLSASSHTSCAERAMMYEKWGHTGLEVSTSKCGYLARRESLGVWSASALRRTNSYQRQS